MKQGQLDIFGVLAEEQESTLIVKPATPKRKRSRKSREVKKAPMLVDAFANARGQMHEIQDAENETRNPKKEIKDADCEALAAKSAIEATPHVYTVSEITATIKNLLEDGIASLWLSGEITDFRNRTGRHLYFALKDQTSKIRAVIFGAEGMRLPFTLADGLEVVCHGKINVYAPQGSYSIIIDSIEPKGIGALQLAFEQLKKKLEAEGLFDHSRKRSLPFLPKKIGVITSPTGAAIRDIVHVLTRRFPTIEILLHPVRVQGDGASYEIADAIERMNSISGLDLLIVGRGGGSMEDLWAFNEEVVARAIAASRLPIISAVGHEIDFTIADFVADVRAATPSAAAEIAVPVKNDILASIDERRKGLVRALMQLITMRGHELKGLTARMPDLRRRLPDLLQRVDGLRGRLIYASKTGLDRRVEMLARFMSNLDHLSPLGILEKGYAVARIADGRVVTRATSLNLGDELGLCFFKGAAKAKVTKIIDE